jgi:pimeloyl-ACP methyl ester carboxylesterase
VHGVVVPVRTGCDSEQWRACEERAPDVVGINQKHEGIAWRSKPSWSIVATEDRTVHPDLERFAAKRMGATTVELKSSHVPMLSQPGFVLDVIRKATKAVDNA